MPVTIVSDNGVQFTSAEFAVFCATNGIEHLTTAPFHPQSNGQAERFVDTFKRAIKKIREERGTVQEALDIFLLTYRSTPNSSTLESKSPSEIMFGRKIRTFLDLLRPPPLHGSAENKQCKRSFQPNDLVYAKVHSQNNWRWAVGVVVEKIGNVMYNVWVEDRRMMRSHINQLRERTPSCQSLKKQPKQNLSTARLPLDILLDAWNLPTQCTDLQPLIPTSSVPDNLASDVTLQGSPIARASSTPQHDQCANMSGDTSSSSSSLTTPPTATSSEFESAVEAEPVVDLPRRSLRKRKAPQWFDPYHLY